MPGKRIRLARLFRRTKRTCLFPIDHGLTMGPTAGLVNPYNTIARLLDGDADGIIVHKGLLERIAQHQGLVHGNYVLHVSGSTTLNHGNREKCLVSTVVDAVRLGAVGVSIHVNLGDRSENQMLADFGFVASQCYEWGMPLVAMMYVTRDGDPDAGPSTTIEHIAHAARIAEELGADVVKVSMPSDIRRFRQVVEGVSIPVVVAGGAKSDEPLTFLRNVSHALEAGAAGVAVGRNVFQSNSVAHMAKLIGQLVHSNIGLDDCAAQIGA